MEWFDEFLEPYDPIHDAEAYLNVKDALQWHRVFYQDDLANIAEIMDDEPNGTFTTYLEEVRPQVTMVYHRLRKHFEETEEYEKCSRCIELEKEIRYEFLQMQIRNEKKESERNTRRMGIQKSKK